METILCPKCGTETDASKSQCEYCGKIIIAEKLLQTPKKVKPDDSRSSRSMGKVLDKLDDHDLFGELEPFDLGDEGRDDLEDDGLFPSSKKKTKTTKSEDEEDEDFDDYDDIDMPKRFENPMAKSKLMKKIKEDQDLFGSLDD